MSNITLARLVALATTQQAALQKVASTALVRRILAGQLSPATIQRAAEAMPEGTFRYVKNLGRGQFNIADQIVGNVGGHAGELVRKLPTHKYVKPEQSYANLREVVDEVNRRIPTPTGNPLIAPYVAVSNKGAFQRLANLDVALPSRRAKADRQAIIRHAGRYIGDLHEDNIGKGGQIIDFHAHDVGFVPSTIKRVDGGRGFLDVGNSGIFGLGRFDQRGNSPAGLKFNNDVRRYYNKLNVSDRINDPQAVGVNVRPGSSSLAQIPQMRLRGHISSLPTNLFKMPPPTIWDRFSGAVQGVREQAPAALNNVAAAFNKVPEAINNMLAMFGKQKIAADNSITKLGNFVAYYSYVRH